MAIYYYNIEGLNVSNDDTEYGFFVHALVATETEQEGLKTVSKELEKDGLKVRFVHHRGEFRTFEWEDEELALGLAKLARGAEASPEQAFFGSFHTYPVGES